MNAILPLKHLKMGSIGIVGNSNSTLARFAELVLAASVVEDAYPLNLSSTSSTLVSMAIGDALAISTIKAKKFSPEDFAQFYSGRSLGRALRRNLRNGMIPLKSCPVLRPTNCNIKDVIVSLSGNSVLGSFFFRGR